MREAPVAAVVGSMRLYTSSTYFCQFCARVRSSPASAAALRGKGNNTTLPTKACESYSNVASDRSSIQSRMPPLAPSCISGLSLPSLPPLPPPPLPPPLPPPHRQLPFQPKPLPPLPPLQSQLHYPFVSSPTHVRCVNSFWKVDVRGPSVGFNTLSVLPAPSKKHQCRIAVTF